MRISDWSSDVCSSDLKSRAQGLRQSRECGENRRKNGLVHGLSGQLVKDSSNETVMAISFISRPPDLFQPTQTTRRSEEHTSELQSLMRISYAVFFLKKK